MRALLVDTNFSAGPLRQALIEQGHEVWVIGSNRGDALASEGDRYLEIDYANTRQLISVIERLAIEAVVPGCNDLSYAVCCEVAATLQLRGFEAPSALRSLHQKAEFRALCRSLKIPAPRTYATTSDATKASGQIIVKPTDSYSGKGIQVLERPTEKSLDVALRFAETQSRTNSALMEDFVDGSLFSYSAFLSRGKVVKAFNVAEFGSVNPFVVDTSYVTQSARMEPALKEVVEGLAASLDIRSGLMHLQYIFDGTQYWMIEATRRCPGDLYCDLIRRSTGFSYASAYVAPFIDNQLQYSASDENLPIVRHTVAADRTAVFESLSFLDNVDLQAWHPLARTGDLLSASPAGRIGVAFFGTSGFDDIEHLVGQLLSSAKYTVQYRESNNAY